MEQRIQLRNVLSYTFVLLSAWSVFTNGCVTPESDANFDDFALRSDIVVEATPIRNFLLNKTRFNAVFRVTKTLDAKKGNLDVGKVFAAGAFGTLRKCIKPKSGKKYIMFLQSSPRSTNGRPFHPNRYNPVISSTRNLKFFNSVLTGKYKGKVVLRSGCRIFREPKHSIVTCSPDKVRCRIACEEGFKHTTGARFKACHAATGLWYPIRNAICVPEGKNFTIDKNSTQLPVGIETPIVRLKQASPKRKKPADSKQSTANKQNQRNQLKNRRNMATSTAKPTTRRAGTTSQGNRSKSPKSPRRRFPNLTGAAARTAFAINRKQKSMPTKRVWTKPTKTTTPVQTSTRVSNESPKSKVVDVVVTANPSISSRTPKMQTPSKKTPTKSTPVRRWTPRTGTRNQQQRRNRNTTSKPKTPRTTNRKPGTSNKNRPKQPATVLKRTPVKKPGRRPPAGKKLGPKKQLPSKKPPKKTTTTSTTVTTTIAEETTTESQTKLTSRATSTTTTKATTTTPRTRPTLPTYRPLQPLTTRRAFLPRRRQSSSVNRPSPTPTRRSTRRASKPPTTARTRPPLPVFKSLTPLRNLPAYPRRQTTTSRPRSIAVLKAAPPKPVLGEELENVDDKFAVANVGDEWVTEDGLLYKPELALNKTVYGCPQYDGNLTIFSSWPGGFNAMVEFPSLPKPIYDGWLVRVKFDFPIVDIETHVVNFFVGTEDRTVVTFTPKAYMNILYLNQKLTVAFVARMEPYQSFAPSGKGYLLGKCSDELVSGKAVGSMFQGQTVLDSYGPDSRPQEIPAAPTRETTTTTTTAAPTTTTEQTPPPRPLGGRTRGRPPAGRGGTRTRTAGRTRTGRARSVFNSAAANNKWPQNRCLPASSNGVLPKGGTTRPDWKKSTKKSAYNYNEILYKSNLFYLAQKSGKLPKVFPIPWRGDSALKDGCLAGHVVHGGLYNGGGHEKSTMAIAFTTTMLAWGAIDYKAAYTEAGEYDDVVKLIKSNAKYLIRCHTAKNELIVQVGKYDSSGSSWSRPEEISTEGRVIYQISSTKPGQDVAAETAAALAATAIVVKATDSKLSQECLLHAKQLYTFARKYPGQYSKVVPSSVNNYHTMSGTLDDLAWAMLWIGKATGSQSYYKTAETMYSKISSKKINTFDWSEKTNALPVLLTKFAKKNTYKANCRTFVNRWRTNSTKSKNKQLWLGSKGTNMLTANAAFLALQVASIHKGFPYASIAATFAEQQMHLLLGDAGRSYVVGFGKDFPRRPRHMASSCGDVPASCDTSVLRVSADNPHTLHGALVGGPDRSGKYNDLITEDQQNEVAIDFNAGFQSAIAGLKEAQLPGKSLISSTKNSGIRRFGQPVRKGTVVG